MSGKRTREIVKEKPGTNVPLNLAVEFIKNHANAKFDETIEIHFHLGVDPKQTEQNVRGTVSLPNGSPSSVRVAVFTDSSALQEKAKEAGADIVGGKELIEEVATKKTLNADVTVTTPDMMKELAKVAKVLGPRGLMPNPKSGTIGPDPASIVKSLKSGKINFKMDDSANVHIPVAKASWETEKIYENAKAVVDVMRQSRPVAAKGEFILSATLSSSMGTGVRVQI